MSDEPASLLNTTQREYLRDEINPDDQRERRIRMDIRNRVIQAFYDFILLDNQLSADDREQLFAKASGEPLTGQPRTSIDYAGLSLIGVEFDGKTPHLMDGLRATVSFIYRGLRDYGYSDDDFGRLVEQGLYSAISKEADGLAKPGMVDADIRITRRWDVEQLYTRWKDGEILAADELLRVVISDEFGAEDLEQLQAEFEPSD